MKKILACILVAVLCLSLAACGKENQTVENIDDVGSYEKFTYIQLNYLAPPLTAIEEGYLSNPDAFIAKVTVGKGCKNVLIYKQEEDVEQYFKDPEGYSKLPKDEQEFPLVDVIDYNNSYMLTPVTVDSIYYLGDNIKMKAGDNITIREFCFVASSFDRAENDSANDIEKKLHLRSGNYKLEPGEEYIILAKNTEDGVYGLSSRDFYEFKADKTKPEGYYDSENAQQVIDDITEIFTQRVLKF